MKKLSRVFVYISFLFLFTATFCENTDEGVALTCDQRLELLNELSIDIEDLVNASECSEAFECRYIAFGSKPCGGPWTYLIYTTSIDTLQLQGLVQEYNDLNNNYNLNCDIASDCSVAVPPSGFECIDNTCNPIF